MPNWKIPAFVLAFVFPALGHLALAQAGALRKDQTIAQLNLPAAERAQIIGGVEAAAFDSPGSWEDELRAREVSLGKSRGLVVSGTRVLCGATGNCQIFVFRRLGRDWIPLFAPDQAPIVEAFSFGPAASRGVDDLHVSVNLSVNESGQATYRFDGKYYRKVK